MKEAKHNLMWVSLLLGLCASSQQGTLKLDVAYRVAMPLSNFKNSVAKTSFNGWEAGILYGITNQIQAGVQTGFQDFYQKYGRQMYHTGGSDLSAVVSNSVQVIPLLAKGKYSFLQTGLVQPFVAVGVGGSLVQYSRYYGQFSDSHSGFSFTAQPEVGFRIPVGRAKRAGVHIAAAYNYMPFKWADIDGLHAASVKAGISVPLR